MKMENGSPIPDFIGSIKELIVQLISVRESIHDSIIVHIALNVLLANYESFV